MYDKKRRSNFNGEYVRKGIEELNCDAKAVEAFEFSRIRHIPVEYFKNQGEVEFAKYYNEYLAMCEYEKLKKFVKDIFTIARVGDTGLCITDVIFNDPATIVKWSDGTKTVVKCGEHDTYDREKGLAMAIIKKLCGNTGNFNEIFKACGCYSREVPEETAEMPIEKPVEEPKEEVKAKKTSKKKKIEEK